MVNYNTQEYKSIHLIDFYRYSMKRFNLIIKTMLFDPSESDFLLVLKSDNSIFNKFPLSMVTRKEAENMKNLGLIEFVEDNVVKIKKNVDLDKISEKDSIKNRHLISNYKRYIFIEKDMGLNLMGLIIRDDAECKYCDHEFLLPTKQVGITRHEKFPTIDHVHPKYKGGKNTWENTILCCSVCNSNKGHKITDKAIKILEDKILIAPKLEDLNNKSNNIPYYLSIFPNNWMNYFDLTLEQSNKLKFFIEKNEKNKEKNKNLNLIKKNFDILYLEEKEDGHHIDSYGNEYWLKDRKFHREDGPAVIRKIKNKEIKEYYINGMLHRDNDLPAVEIIDKVRGFTLSKWYFKNELHRDNDLPSYISKNTYKDKSLDKSLSKKAWHKNDKLFRINNGPTVVQEITSKKGHFIVNIYQKSNGKISKKEIIEINKEEPSKKMF
jgi:5-methylcytosine-specific restriction endonuclease McrA